MDRLHKAHLAQTLRDEAHDGAAVLVATHDPEFAVAFADRVVLMGEGELIADGDPHDVLAGGWYFATETARVCGALTPEEGAAFIAQASAGTIHATDRAHGQAGGMGE